MVRWEEASTPVDDSRCSGVARPEPVVSDPSWPTGTLLERVEAALQELRPAVKADGGDVVLSRIDGDVVVVRLQGACNRCPMAQSTLTDLVSERIKLYAPEISDVRSE